MVPPDFGQASPWTLTRATREFPTLGVLNLMINRMKLIRGSMLRLIQLALSTVDVNILVPASCKRETATLFEQLFLNGGVHRSHRPILVKQRSHGRPTYVETVIGYISILLACLCHISFISGCNERHTARELVIHCNDRFVVCFG